MGKKYLETKEKSLESSVLGIWQEAAKNADELDEAKFSPKEIDVIENTMAKVREFKIQDMKSALAQVWGMEEGKNPFKKEEEEKPVITKGGKTLTGKKPAEIDVKPKINKEA